MKTCSRLRLAMIVFICWFSKTSVTGQGIGRSGYEIDSIQSCKKCPFNQINFLKCNSDKRYTHITAPLSARGALDFCRICERALNRHANKKSPFRCGTNDLSDAPNLDSGFYGQTSYPTKRKTGVDAALIDDTVFESGAHIGGGLYDEISDYSGGEGLFSKGGNGKGHFGWNPYAARPRAPELPYKPVVYPSKPPFGADGEDEINRGLGISNTFLERLFSRADSNDRVDDNIRRTQENKMGFFGDNGHGSLVAGRGLRHEDNFRGNDNREGLRQIYSFGLG